MSLRIRLTLLYATLLGGILLLFGVLVYVLASALLLDQVDNTLKQTTIDIINTAQIDPIGGMDIVQLPGVELTSSVYAQFWGRDGQLKMSSPVILKLGLPPGSNLQVPPPALRDVTIRSEEHTSELQSPAN
jgi:two-component system OmpR family sensor kinase